MTQTACEPAIILPGDREMPRKRWTRDEYREAIRAGILADGKYELLEGEIFPKMVQGRRHILICMRIIKALADVFGFDYIQSQSSLPLNMVNEPEPDAAVLAQKLDQYLDVAPGPSDVRLIVEVSETTLLTDRTVKATLYAQAGIPEYWIVNVQAQVLEVFRQPAPLGYAQQAVFGREDTISPLSAPESTVRVADLLP